MFDVGFALECGLVSRIFFEEGRPEISENLRGTPRVSKLFSKGV